MSEGSSPRVRGRLVSASTLGEVTGLIPASAGQTKTTTAETPPPQAHPRECGADQSPSRCRLARRGSSPRVRGRRCCPRFRMGRSGLIPASAGQTGVSMWARIAARAHPRECGADTIFTTTGDDALGSSPRVRGRPSRGDRNQRQPRLIPASAGQTARTTFKFPAGRAHPRECGADFSEYTVMLM